MIHVIRTEHLWQRAGVYYVRTQAMVKGFHVPLEKEFDEGDTPETQYLLVLDEALPIGTCRLHITGEDTAKIERVCVLEEYRGKGIGKTAILAAEAWLLELGVKTIVITSRYDAVGFYEALGYQADHAKTDDTGIFQTIYMIKQLNEFNQKSEK